VLESQGAFSRVRIYDGTAGRVKSAFLVEDPPEKPLCHSVSEQNEKLEQQNQTLHSNTVSISSIGTDKVIKLQRALEEQCQVKQQPRGQLNLVQQQSHLNNSFETLLVTNNPNETVRTVNPVLNDRLLLGSIAVTIAPISSLFGINLSSQRVRNRLHGFQLD